MTLPETNMAPEKWMVDILVSFWEGLLSEAMLGLGSVDIHICFWAISSSRHISNLYRITVTCMFISIYIDTPWTDPFWNRDLLGCVRCLLLDFTDCVASWDPWLVDEKVLFWDTPFPLEATFFTRHWLVLRKHNYIINDHTYSKHQFKTL